MNIKFFSFLIFITQLGCGEEELCQSSDLKLGGLCIQKGFDVREGEINAMIDVLETTTQKHYPEVVDIAGKFRDEKVRVEFTKDDLALHCEKYEKDVYQCKDLVLGVNYGGHHIYLSYDECLGDTALSHELLHSIEQFYLGVKSDKDKSNDHLTPWLFMESLPEDEWASLFDVVEVRAMITLRCTLERCLTKYQNDYMCTHAWPYINEWESN